MVLTTASGHPCFISSCHKKKKKKENSGRKILNGNNAAYYLQRIFAGQKKEIREQINQDYSNNNKTNIHNATGSPRIQRTRLPPLYTQRK